MNHWKKKAIAVCVGVMLTMTAAVAQDWYEATGKPVARSLLNSADLRTEFASIQSDIADQMPALTGNGDKVVVVNSGGTALTVATTGVAVSAGGTGATGAVTARTNLGLAIGTDVQAYDTDLADIAALSDADGNFIVGNGSAWSVESGATARTSMGTDDASNITAGTLPDARLSSNVPLITTGSFSATLSGMASGGTGTVYYEVTGNLVHMYLQSNITGTSNAVTMTMTTLPSAIRPSFNQLVPILVSDNGGTFLGFASFTDSGTVTFSIGTADGSNVGVQSTGFTSSGSKGLFSSSVATYLLN